MTIGTPKLKAIDANEFADSMLASLSLWIGGDTRICAWDHLNDTVSWLHNDGTRRYSKLPSMEIVH